jgi:O-antigen/teichoic acid export membrane protein
MLLGAWQGLAATALFNRGNTLVRFFRSGVENAIQPIALSEFTRNRDDPVALKNAYFTAVGLLTGISWPALACFIILSRPMILTLFGPRWVGATELAQILSVGAMIFAATALAHQLHGAVKQTRLLLYRESAMQLPRIAILFATAPISSEAVAWGLVAVIFLASIVTQKVLQNAITFRTLEFFKALHKSALVTIGTALATLAAIEINEYPLRPWQEFFGFGAVAAVAWVCCLWATRHPLYVEAVGLLRRRAARI